MGKKRRSPKPHRVRTKDPRYNINGYNRGKSIFFESKYRKYSEMIRIDTLSTAKDSIKRVLDEFESAKQPTKMRRLISEANCASNRAMIASKNPRNSPEERKESAEVAKLWRKA